MMVLRAREPRRSSPEHWGRGPQTPDLTFPTKTRIEPRSATPCSLDWGSVSSSVKWAEQHLHPRTVVQVGREPLQGGKVPTAETHAPRCLPHLCTVGWRSAAKSGLVLRVHWDRQPHPGEQAGCRSSWNHLPQLPHSPAPHHAPSLRSQETGQSARLRAGCWRGARHRTGTKQSRRGRRHAAGETRQPWDHGGASASLGSGEAEA